MRSATSATPGCNGAAISAGFTDPSTGAGLWLAGDYSEEKIWPYVRVASVNDGSVAQAATVRQLTRLFTTLYDTAADTGAGTDDTRLDPTGCRQVLALLHEVTTDPLREVFLNRLGGGRTSPSPTTSSASGS